MIERGASVHDASMRGITPLHSVAMHGMGDVHKVSSSCELAVAAQCCKIKSMSKQSCYLWCLSRVPASKKNPPCTVIISSSITLLRAALLRIASLLDRGRPPERGSQCEQPWQWQPGRRHSPVLRRGARVQRGGRVWVFVSLIWHSCTCKSGTVPIRQRKGVR